MRLILTTIAFILIASPGWAETESPDHAVIAPPSCSNNLGESVLFKERNSDNAKFAAGMARRDGDGNPVVNRFNFDQAPAPLQAFIDLHECAHHQTGDIDRPHPPRNSPEHLMNESIADCIAILRIRDDARYSEIDFADVATSLGEAMGTAGFPEISISSRVSNIRHCHTNYASAATFVDGVLTERGLK